MAAAGLGASERALRIGAAADQSLRELGVEHMVPFWQRLITDHMQLARTALGKEPADRAWDAGARLGLESAVDEVLRPS